MMKKTLLTIIGSAIITGSILSAAPTITDTYSSNTPSTTEEGSSGDESSVEKRGPIAIDLLTDLTDDTYLAPGEEVIANVRIRNAGTEPAHVFVEVTDPQVIGAITLEGEEDPRVVEFEAGEGWEEVKEGVYYYEEPLSPGQETTPLIDTCSIPNYNLTIEGDEVMTGTVSMDEVEELLASFNMMGYSIQGSLKGTPAQIWTMVKGE